MEADLLASGLSEGSDRSTARLLRLKDVLHRVGLGRSTIYSWMDEGKLPKPHSIGDYAVRGLKSDVDACIASKISHDGANYRYAYFIS